MHRKENLVTRLHVLSAYESEEDRYSVNWIRSLEDGGLTQFASAEEADVILFVENHPATDPFFMDVYRHALHREFPKKCVLFHDADRSVTLMPTLTPSVEQWQMGCGLVRPFHYFFARFCENEAIQQFEQDPPAFEPTLLASFVGASRTHPIRRRVLSLNSSDIYCHDSLEMRMWKLPPAEKAAYEQQFVETMVNSHFVLCPRGYSPSSYRLYEAMLLGRVPVIISDEWVAPAGPIWEECSIRIPESEVGNLPAILKARIPDAAMMGLAARDAWEKFFSPQVTLDRLAHGAQDLINTPNPAFAKVRAATQFLKHGNARRFVGWSGRRMVAKFRK